MFATSSTIVDSATILLSLSKTAWKLGLSLSKLSQHVAFVDTIISDLAAEAKALSVACDFIYTRLKELADRNTPIPIDGNDASNELWDCLTSQIDVIGDTTVELEHFVKSDDRLDSQSVHRLQHLNRPSPQRDFILALRIKISRHTDDLTMTLLLINSVFIGAARHRDPRETSHDLERLPNVIKKLETTLMEGPQSRISRIEAKLIRCARETIAQVSFTHEDAARTYSTEEGQNEQKSSTKSENWLEALGTLQLDQRNPGRPTTAILISPRVSAFGKHTLTVSTEYTQIEDDFDADLAKAALDTGIEAFNAQAWEEADSLLQEALRALLQLSQEKRAFSDIFSLHYRLAVCGYYIREPEDAEKGLISLAQSTPSTDEQRMYIYHAMHLLSQLYIRTNQIDRARSECEKALQGRRRVSGKQSLGAMESIALMAHIYVLLDNRPRAKSCLAMIPEAQRDPVLETVEASLGGLVEHLDFASLLSPASVDDSMSIASRDRRRLSSVSDESHTTTRAAPGRLLASPLGMYRQDSSREPIDTIEASPTPSQSQFATVTTSPKIPQSSLVQRAMLEDDPPVWETPVSSSNDETRTQDTEPIMDAAVHKESLSRREILQRIGCQPRDKIEDAVYTSDHAALVALLKKKKSFWRSSMRKRGRSERVTALHFAALFGELQMARLLIDAKFDVNEVPFGYSTSLTPLHFAIGARQVPMVDLLLAHGAKPCDGECWTTLAKQLLSRAWLTKTTSETDRVDVPARVIAIFTLLLKHGWKINEPSGEANDTILHQAVGFWTGSFKWDLDLRVAVAAFLCDRGADSRMKNAEGKSPYDAALASGQQDLIKVLEASSSRKELEGPCRMPVELPGEIYDGKSKSFEKTGTPL